MITHIRRPALCLALLLAALLWAAEPPVDDPIPARTEGTGPYARVVLRNVTIVNGTGAPAQGPYDVVLAQDRIAEIRSIGNPGATDFRFCGITPVESLPYCLSHTRLAYRPGSRQRAARA